MTMKWFVCVYSKPFRCLYVYLWRIGLFIGYLDSTKSAEYFRCCIVKIRKRDEYRVGPKEYEKQCLLDNDGIRHTAKQYDSCRYTTLSNVYHVLLKKLTANVSTPYI